MTTIVEFSFFTMWNNLSNDLSMQVSERVCRGHREDAGSNVTFSFLCSWMKLWCNVVWFFFFLLLFSTVPFIFPPFTFNHTSWEQITCSSIIFVVDLTGPFFPFVLSSNKKLFLFIKMIQRMFIHKTVCVADLHEPICAVKYIYINIYLSWARGETEDTCLRSFKKFPLHCSP